MCVVEAANEHCIDLQWRHRAEVSVALQNTTDSTPSIPQSKSEIQRHKKKK